MGELEAEKSRLTSRYKRLQEKLEGIRAQPMESQVQKVREIIESPSPPPAKVRHVERNRGRTNASILEKLYDDVASIVDSHLSKTESMTSLETLDRPNAKWRQMYEEVYGELEKVRNMLVIQHNINEKQMREINLLNDEARHYRREYEKKLNELVTELDNRAKHIDVLENQIRSIAGGDVSRVLPSEPPMDVSITGNELILKLTKLSLNEEGTKLSSSAKPMLFLALEFFDFELQTTPLIQGPETSFDYSSVYDVIISNLFIHYIETDGITVELFEVKGVNYEQWGAGTVSLKRLLDVSTPANITGRLQIHSINDQATSIGTLEYRLEVPFNLIKALNAQKRRITASTYLPIAEEADRTLYNELVIQVHRASNLNAIFPNNPSLSTYIAYQIYDLPPHLANVITSNSNPEYNDTRAWTLPIGTALHQYLKGEEFPLYVMEDVANLTRGLPSGSTRYGMVKVPMFPLARNQKLSGTFSLVGTNGEVSKASIDFSIFWKYAYKFNDEDLAVNAPVPVEIRKEITQEKPAREAPKPTVEDQRQEKPLKPIKMPSTSSISSTEQESVIEVKKPKAAEDISESSEEILTGEKSGDSELLRQLLQPPKPPPSLPEIEQGKVEAEKELEAIEKEEEMRRGEGVKDLPIVDKILEKQSSQESNATYEVSDEEIDEKLRDQIPEIEEAERGEEPPKEADLLPQKEDDLMPSPHTGSTTTESQLRDLESLAEELNDTDGSRKPSVSEVLDEELPLETPPPNQTESKRLAFSGRLQPLPPVRQLSQPNKEEEPLRGSDVTKSLLGELPNLETVRKSSGEMRTLETHSTTKIETKGSRVYRAIAFFDPT